MFALLALMVTTVGLLATASRLRRHDEIWPAARSTTSTEPYLVRERRRPVLVVPDPEGPPRPRPQHGQLVFAEPMTDGRIGLDCLLTDTPGDAAGRPAQVVAALPANPWLAVVEQELLLQWLALGDDVDVWVSADPAVPRVKIACRRTTLLLDQQPA